MASELRATFENSLWIEQGESNYSGAIKSSLEDSMQIKMNSCRSLEEAATHLSKASPFAVFYVLGSESPDQLESLNRWMRTSLPLAGLVLVSQKFSQQDLWSYSKLNALSSFLDLSLSQSSVEQALNRVHEVVSANQKKARMADSLKVQNKQLETMNESLEKIVRDRTADIQEKKNQIEIHVNKVKKLLAFIKDLSKVSDIGDLSHLIRKEIKSLVKSGEPYLAFQAGDFGNWIYTIHQNQLIEKNVDTPWKSSPRIRLNDIDDKTYLANLFSKPIQKMMAIPLSHNERQSSQVTLFIEHDLPPDQVESLLEEIGKRAQSLSLCLDRALLEIELKRSAFLWESTFDSIDEPIVITDESLNVIRANKSFQSQIKDWFSSPDSSSHLEPVKKSGQQAKSFMQQLRINDQFFEWKTYPILDSKRDRVDSVVSLFVDTTQEKRLQSKMIQHEKMTAMGHLAGNIAHELNNPLAGLASLCQVVLSEVPADSPLKADLAEILSAAQRSSEIIKNLLDFSNPTDEDSLEVIDLNELTRKTLPLLKSITSSFQRNITFANKAVPVRVNPQLIQQVLFNLVNNACQAMGEKGELTIEIDRIENEVQVKVEDTGCGVKEEDVSKVFEPFFSTKLDSGGTGIGLSMSRNIVRSYGGEIHFESEEGKGAAFFMRLPITEE